MTEIGSVGACGILLTVTGPEIESARIQLQNNAEVINNRGGERRDGGKKIIGFSFTIVSSQVIVGEKNFAVILKMNKN